MFSFCTIPISMPLCLHTCTEANKEHHKNAKLNEQSSGSSLVKLQISKTCLLIQPELHFPEFSDVFLICLLL